MRSRRQLLHELCRKYGERIDDVVAYADATTERLGDRKSTRLNSSHAITSRMPSSA